MPTEKFVYTGQCLEFREYGMFNTLTTHISGFVDGRPKNYDVVTKVGTKGNENEGAVSVAETNSVGRYNFTVVVEAKGEKAGRSGINWENGLRAHTRTVERLVKGQEVRDLDISSDLWSLDSE